VLLVLAACASAPQSGEGLRLYEAGEYDKALVSFSAALKENPEDADAYYRRACCRMHLMDQNGIQEGTAQQALSDLDRAVEIAPDDYRAYYARAMLYAALARYKESAHDLLVCVQSQDKTLKRKSHKRLAEIYDEKFEDMQIQALKHYEAYLQMGGLDAAAIKRHAELKKSELERAGQPDLEKAQLELLQRAKQHSAVGRHADALELVAKILSEPALSKEFLQEARDLYIRERLAVETDRKADALFDTAQGLIKSGKLDSARDLLEELVKKYPATEAARSKAPAALVELLKKPKQ